MVATTLNVGEIAIIGVNTEDSPVPQRDSISFILLKPIGSGTVIYFTDRAWNGSAFAAAGGGEGTYTFTAATDLPAGTVITISLADLTAAGISLADTGETIYVYQGTNANTPTRFLHAVDIADGTTGFEGTELTGTGLVSGTSAVALGTGGGIADIDNAEFGGRTHNIQAAELFARINTANNWVQNSNSPQDGTANGTPATVAPDAQLWIGGAGGGEAIVTINLDATFSSGTVGYQIVQAFQNDPNLNSPRDITLDTVEGKYFFVDSDANGNNRILQGSISQLLANPGAPLAVTVLYSNTGTGADGVIGSLAVDTINNKIYFDVGTAATGSTINRINYDTASQTPTVLATLGTDHYVTQLAIDFTRGEVFVATSQVDSVFGTDFIAQNYVYRANAGSAAALSTAAAGSLVFTELPFSPDDTDQTGEGGELPGEAFPVEFGFIRGIDVDPVSHALIIVTGSATLDNDGDGSTTYTGRIIRYALDSNPTGTFTTLYQQTGTPGDPGTGPRGLLYYVEVDAATGRYYVIDESGLSSSAEDASVWTGSLTVAGTPTLLATVGNINGLGARGLEILHAPTLTAVGAGPAITETAGNPSPNPTPQLLGYTFTSGDVDSASSPTQQLAGAQVRISNNFQAGIDFLLIGGATSGTLASGITYSYNATTGVLTLSGINTFANYNAALAAVQFRVNGDNPTNYGTAGSRQFAVSVFDGALYSDEVFTTMGVIGLNDAPVNTVGGALNINEDASATALTGISIVDVDADPATALMTVQFSVARGIITLNTAVAGGVTAGQITAGVNGSATLTVTATQNAINATLANATGLTYTPTANVNGADALTIVTSDAGATGTGGTLSDTDNKTITVTAVNDAPVASGSATMTTILEDATPAGQTVAALFGGNFSDATDQVTGGSSANTLAGVVIVGNVASANGVWQYFDGAAWVAIPTGLAPSSGRSYTDTTLIRFLPAANFNGTAPTLTATLVDSSGGALTNNAVVNAATNGGTTRFSSGTVVLSQSVTAVNDAPTSTGLQGDATSTTEPAGAGSVMPRANIDVAGDATFADVDNANFNGGTLRFAITSGLVAAQDQLNVDVTGIVTIAAGTVSVSGTPVGTITGGGAGGGDIVIALNANATPAIVQTLARFVQFTNTGGDNPTAGTRTITTTLVDGSGTANAGQDTLTITSTVTVAATNDAPTITGLPSGTTFTPGVAGNANFSPTTIADPDSATVTATIQAAGATGSFTAATVAGVTVGGSGTTLTLTGTATALNAYLDTVSNVQFTPLGNGSFTLTITASDGALTSTTPQVGVTSTFTANSIAAFGTLVTQNFDQLLQSGASMTPTGWTFLETGTGANPAYGGGTGSNNTGDTYSFGAAASTERAFGGLQSGAVIPTIGGAFTNNTGGVITSLVVSYTGEQWRLGTAGRQDRLDFAYSTDATSLAAGNWTNVDALDFSSPNTTTLNALDGNAAANRTAITFEITGLSIAPGATFWFRWQDFNATGADDGLAIDDFSIIARSVAAVNDSGALNENATILNGNLFTNDVNLGGGPALAVAQVNGVAGNVGNQITLASGALLTVRADGTYDYNPNGQFNSLIDAATATATGATNTSANDTFTYTLAGGQTATVTVAVNGVASAGDQLGGNGGNNTITGTPGVDFFNLSAGGDDIVNGGDSNDAFQFGAAFTATDTVDGGAGTNDQIGLQGNYTGGNALTLGATTITNVEVIAVLPGFDYNLTTVDANVGAGQELVIFGGNLGAGDDLTFNGSLETNGTFRVYGGQGTDLLTGGAGNDGFYFGPGKYSPTLDLVTGGGGTNDQLALDGSYTVLLTDRADVEVIALLPGPSGSPNNFSITLDNSFVGAGASKTIWGAQVTTAITIDGTAEADGNLTYFGGQASDTLYGGSGVDVISGGGGGDFLFGGAGVDTFRYDFLTDSNGSTDATRDRIVDFTSGTDKIDLSRLDAITGGGDDAFTFIGAAAFGNVAGQLRYTNTAPNTYVIEGDVDGDGNADFTIQLATPVAPVSTDFVL